MSVTIEAEKSTIVSDEPVGLLAKCDPASPGLTFTWSVDGMRFTDLNAGDVWYSGLAGSDTSVEIKVEVTDPDVNSATATKVLTLMAGGSLHLMNNAPNQIQGLQFGIDPAYASNRLSVPLSNGGKVIFHGIPAGARDVRIEYDAAQYTSTGFTSGSPNNVYTAGLPKECYFSGNSASSMYQNYPSVPDKHRMGLKETMPLAYKYQ